MLSGVGVVSLAMTVVHAWGWPPVTSSPVSRPASPPVSSIFGIENLPTDAKSLPPGAGTSAAEIKGSLDKEIIRRIIRRHVDQVKGCYEPHLATKPTLEGTIRVTFTVDAEGKVVNSVLHSSTMDSPEVEQCTVDAVRTWEFPKPKGGGKVVITYPFRLTPGPGGE